MTQMTISMVLDLGTASGREMFARLQHLTMSTTTPAPAVAPVEIPPQPPAPPKVDGDTIVGGTPVVSGTPVNDAGVASGVSDAEQRRAKLQAAAAHARAAKAAKVAAEAAKAPAPGPVERVLGPKTPEPEAQDQRS